MTLKNSNRFLVYIISYTSDVGKKNWIHWYSFRLNLIAFIRSNCFRLIFNGVTNFGSLHTS